MSPVTAIVNGKARPLQELRRDPVTGRWVIIATDRAKRPSDFIRDPVRPRLVGVCPFCAGNEDRTPPTIMAYATNGDGAWRVRVMSNKFPALRVEGTLDRAGDGVYDRMNGIGAHEVVVECPEHRISVADIPPKQVEELFWAYRDRVLDLKKDARLRFILLFKNHGQAAGASVEHTHSQLIALPVVPASVQGEIDGARRHFEYKERCIYCDIVQQERVTASRVVWEGDHVLAIAPYASRFPFETWLVPKRHGSHFENADSAEIGEIAWAFRTMVRKMERVLEHPAYNMVLHSAPIQEHSMPHYHWHVEIIPRLTRVAGFEWGTGFHINPTPPEEAAAFLREADAG